ncbi:hypothetical protein [Cellulomonas wangsupingiae]|uniref:DUF4352 domain-containing protein n=1 Tax=Cellulomonas wangsupingiae TaxID=2968085 RepID=A0ABY5K4C6_9CELL|nr:hypothetical protein [Cellulomonas wangsupingiae]MCC2334060.1 hypothetical protein [Cellulomonas wangsupingiae]UUI65307.1 hypothetical protein NP075_00765 [Cellulomonas wangsupingiae]
MTTERPDARRTRLQGLASVPTPRSGVPTTLVGVGTPAPTAVTVPEPDEPEHRSRAVVAGVVVVVLVTLAALAVVLQIAFPGAPATAPPRVDQHQGAREHPGSVVQFGQAHTYGDGLEVVVGVPQPYEPSDNATGLEQGVPVRVQVVVTNGTEEGFRPNTLEVAATSGGSEAVNVWDPDQGIGLTGPDVSVPAGGTLQFALAFAAADPADLHLELTPALYGYGALVVEG